MARCLLVSVWLADNRVDLRHLLNRLSLFTVAVCLAMVGAPGLNQVALAQQARGADPRENASMRLGILYLTPSLSIDRLGYESNVLNTSGEPKADFTASVTPRTQIWVPFAKRALLTTNADVSFLYYQDTTARRSVNPSINTAAELYARRVTFLMEAGTARTFRQPNAEIETQVKQRNDTLGAGIRLAMFRGLSLGVSAFNRTTSYEDDASLAGVSLSEALDRTEKGLRITLSERLTSLTTVGLSFETREDRFDRALNRNGDGYLVAGTIALAAKALVSGNVEVGYRKVNPESPLVPEFSGLMAKVAVESRLAGAYQLSLGWDRDLQYSFDQSRGNYVSNGFSARLRKQVASQFDASLGASRNLSSYRNLLDDAGPGLSRERTMTYVADIGYRLRQDSRLAFGVTRTTRDSTIAESRQYSTMFAGLSLNYVF